MGEPACRGARWPVSALVSALVVLGVAAVWSGPDGHPIAVGPAQVEPTRDHPTRSPPQQKQGRPSPRGVVTLAFAGDTHFQLHLAALLGHPRGALGPITSTLRAADLTMVNLESALAVGGTPDPKELEVPANRYWFRTSPRALDVLAEAGVDVVTVANNHGADYGRHGLEETLRARRQAPVKVLGVGRNRREAFTPYRVSIRGAEIAVLAADSSPREGRSPAWAAGRTTAGIAAAHSPRPRALLRAVRVAARRSDVVVVYLHWGTELRSCPDPLQLALARGLAAAGADVVVGSHAHVLLGSGWLGDTYVDYGLGNFLWYHDQEPETGVLQVTVRDGKVAGGQWTPARIQPSGRPSPLTGSDRVGAIAAWHRLRGCAGLSARRSLAPRPAYSWSARRIGTALARRMRFSHHAGCPVPLTDLRYLQMTYRGFDGGAHRGEMVVHRRYVRQVASVFGRLYRAGFPIHRMRLVDEYGGNDRRSMAADNTSGFNCRRVAGGSTWSAHAFGDAVDINPVENPDLTGDDVAPKAGRRFVDVDRSTGTHVARGVITVAGPVVRAFARIGWTWGGSWTSGADFQHFSVGD